MRILLALICTLTLAGFAHADNKVGIVDLKKAVPSTTEGKKIKADLEAEFNKKKKELESQEDTLKKMRDEIEKKKAVLSESALAKKQEDFNNEMVKYRDVVGKSQMDFQKKQQDLMTPIMQKMKKAIEQVAKEKGYSMILEDNSSILYSVSADDLTDEVIKAYDKMK